MTEDGPAPKRTKRSKQSSPQNSNPFYYPDGDIVLEIEGYQFKVHAQKLRCSLIFSDMLEIQQPYDVDSVEGCSLVQLVDSVKDWLVVLRWIYTPE